jgi:hypothetical protein
MEEIEHNKIASLTVIPKEGFQKILPAVAGLPELACMCKKTQDD